MGESGGRKAAYQSYSPSSSHQFEGRFGKCVKVSGPHQIVVQLVDDAGNVLATSRPITVNVRLKGRHDDHAGMDAGDDHGHHDGGDDHGDGGDGDDDDGGHH